MSSSLFSSSITKFLGAILLLLLSQSTASLQSIKAIGENRYWYTNEIYLEERKMAVIRFFASIGETILPPFL